MKNSYYLATTGISEIWNLDCNLLLLGHWCFITEENRGLLEHKNYTIIPSPWKPASKMKEELDYCNKMYEEMLPWLSENLNYIHRVSYPIRYWRILLGTWLLIFIVTLYERYRRIENAFKLFPDFYTNVLPVRDCKLISHNTIEFMRDQINDHYFNLKLFSLAAYEICPQNIIEKNYKSESKWEGWSYSWKRKLFNKLLNSVESHLSGTIVLSDMYHLSFLDKFLLKNSAGLSGIGFLDFNPTEDDPSKSFYSYETRKGFKFTDEGNGFNNLLYKVLPYAVPMCYVENYKLYRNTIKNIRNLDSVKIIGSAIGWYLNEGFKFFAAEAVAKGAKSIEFQHGGGFGNYLVVESESPVLRKDIFCSWGYEVKGYKTVNPLSSPHLSRLKNKHSPQNDKVLFIGTGAPLYQLRFGSDLKPENMPKYFEDKKIFFQTISDEIKSKILYRPYTHEYGWREKEFIKQVSPNVRFLLDGILVDWMKKVKLVIIDHPHTSFIEALTINAPSVFFWDHEVYLMRPGAEPYFELLRKAGILYKDPMSAAEKVNEIWNDIQGWWRQPEVQKAKDEFCYQFARTSKNWRKEWIEFLQGLRGNVKKEIDRDLVV